MNFFHHKDLGNHLLQLCPKVVKRPVYTTRITRLASNEIFSPPKKINEGVGRAKDLSARLCVYICIYIYIQGCCVYIYIYRGADKSLARPGRKEATATEDFEFHISYL